MKNLVGKLSSNLEMCRVSMDSLVGNLYGSAPDREIELLEKRLVGRELPEDFKAFLKFSNGFISIPETQIEGFRGTKLFIQGTRNLISNRQGFLIDCIWSSKYPTEFANILMLGSSDRCELGMWLCDDEKKKTDIILFEPFPRNAYKTRMLFNVIASSWSNFLERLIFCMERDIPLNLLNPSKIEIDFIKDIEGEEFYIGQDFQYSLKKKKEFKPEWRVKDEEQFLKSYSQLMLNLSPINLGA